MTKEKRKKIAIPIIDTDETVKIENVTKRYGKGFANSVTAVDGVSLTIKKGEFAAIVGTSGSGKSTLMHMIGGVEKPTSGKIRICGHDIYEMDDNTLSAFRCREIGMVYQFFNLIPVLNLEENIAFPQIAAGEKPDFEKSAQILQKLNLGKKGDMYPGTLSGGMQQRVAIGRAIANEPSLILADEPTGNLDSKNSKEVIDLLESLCKTMNRTLIIVTHDERIAERADRIIRIEDGKIVSDTRKETAV